VVGTCQLTEKSNSAEQHSIEVLSWSSANLDVYMFNKNYKCYHGEYENHDDFWLFLCTHGGGPLVRKSDGQDLKGLFVPGTVGIGSQADGGKGYWPDMSLVGVGIEPKRLSAIVSELSLQTFDLEAIASRFHQDTLMAELIQEMWSKAKLHAHSAAFIDHGLSILIHQLTKSIGFIKAPETGFRFNTMEMRKVTEFVSSHLSQDITVEMLSCLVSLSPNHFSKCFRITTGLAPYQYVTQCRLDRAADLLISSRLSITHIALAVGYSTPSHFSAAFQRYKGGTPSAWRRAHQG
jgi:AraC family transcriptional regulator